MNFDFSYIDWRKSPYCYSWIGVIIIIIGSFLLMFNSNQNENLFDKIGISLILFGLFIEIFGLCISIYELKFQTVNISDYNLLSRSTNS